MQEEQDPIILRRRIRRLTNSRDQWKEERKKGQIERKRLREKVKDEIERRDRWKASYKLKQQEEKSLVSKVKSLEAQVEHKEGENAELKRQLDEIKKKQKR